MAQSKAIAAVLNSQSPHPDSYSLSPLHPFFSTKVGLSVYLCIFASVRLCSLFISVHEGERDVVQVLLALTSIGLLYTRKCFNFSYTDLCNHVNQHIYHMYQHPWKKGYFLLKPGYCNCFTHTHPVGGWASQRWGRPDSFPETHFKFQGATSLLKLTTGRALGFGAKLSCLNKRVGALRSNVSKWSRVGGVKTHIFCTWVCLSYCIWNTSE